MSAGSSAAVAAIAVTIAIAGCGPPARPSLPSGAGSPFPDFATVYEDAVRECSAVTSITAELALSGRAGSTKLRGRIEAGLATPDDIVLEGFAPVLGRSIFVLSGRGGKALLLLTRDNRILRDAEPSAIVEALAGVALSPAQLRSALAGCGLEKISPSAGRAHGNDWAAVEGGGTMVYLRRIDAGWRVAAATRDNLTVQYSDFKAGRPATVFVRTTVADLALRLSQVEINVPIDPRAFALEIPKDAVPLTLEELRRSGPLGDRDRGLSPLAGPVPADRDLSPLPGPVPASGTCPRCRLGGR